MNWWGTSLMDMFDHIRPGLGVVALAAWIGWIIVSICLHELGHGWAALACGDDTPRLTGHMTINPVKHMGLTSLIVFVATGLAWGFMPVNPSRFRGRYDDALVALAGPMMNIALVVVCVAGSAGSLLVFKDDTNWLFTVFRIGLVLNIALSMLNLIPVPPLDGSKVVAGFVKSLRPVVYSPQGAIAGIIVLVLLSNLTGGLLMVTAIRAGDGAILSVVRLFIPR